MDSRTITREDAAAYLGLSVREVARKQAAGQLRVARRGKRGLVMYDAGEIEELKLRMQNDAEATSRNILARSPYTAEEAAKVFEELEQGSTAIVCVKKCGVHPDKVEAIMRSYERLTSAIILDGDTVTAINQLPLDGTFPITKADDVLSLLSSMAKGTPCAICAKRPRHHCKSCAIPFVKAKLAREAATAGDTG